MNYQKMRIDFAQKRGLTAPFVYKTGEVDVDGIEAELVNIDTDGSPIGFIKLVSPTGIERESALRIENGFAYFDIPKNEEGLYTVELTILNKKNKTRSGNIEIEVINSLSYDSEEYETLLDTITKNDAEFTANENTRISNENIRIVNENARKSAETNRVASMTDIEKRFASLSTAQQQQAEVADARMDAVGTVHANLKTRLDNDFETLASLIPTDIAVSDYETITTNDTLSGDVSGMVATGNTIADLEAQTIQSAELSEVMAHGVNLVDVKNGTLSPTATVKILSKYLKKDKTYTFKINSWNGDVAKTAIQHYSNGKWIANVASSGSNGGTVTALENGDELRFVYTGSASVDYGNVSLYEVTQNTPTSYIPYQESKTTLSEPIILRSLPNGISDTYDVDTGILTRRCGEVVLTGSENWTENGPWANDTHKTFYSGEYQDKTGSILNNDKFVHTMVTSDLDESSSKECCSGSVDAIRFYIRITKSKLPTPDVAGFEAWLAQNPTTVVYQLATPTTEYIENNGQLRSYDSQTTVFANSIVPVKISGNIPVNYASTLANLAVQARNLQIENTALIEQAESLSEQLNNAEQTNNFQDELIDVSLMATDELYVMLEPLLAQPMSATITQNVSDETTKNTQGGNAMVDAYVAMVIRGLKTIDEVPARYREEVRRILAELDK